MGATLVWPTVVVLGFLFVTGIVVLLGTSSTARYEFERGGARTQERTAAQRSGNHPAGRRAAPERAPEARSARPRSARAGGVAVRTAPKATSRATPRARSRATSRATSRAASDATSNAAPAATHRSAPRTAPRTAPATETGPAWWLVGESAQVLAGPFADRVDADWAALADELSAVAVYGVRRADGRVRPKPSPEERAWLGELGRHLDRLPAEWDTLLTDTDPLTTLVVEVAAALVEAGLPLHDAGATRSQGGVCLVPDQDATGLLVSWRPHDRLSVQQVRGGTADDAVQQLMNAAITDVLEQLGFVVQPVGDTRCALVTAMR
ncbi:hypothetical protein [Blastococcus sp. CCUG 61487]|uniref:hypothetical protein n=1 Tax=Blastococcus sp. CCUG 61487 TaxID=1840703 RepID=UPI0010BFC975|nr:hypothetical protein [Blastococcus sp. CCUG 61487]TKJ23394.1 hypothetical protein A6V29_05140 [Blastococcus sp. CCUG 61487]